MFIKILASDAETQSTRAINCMLVATALVSLNDALVKLLATSYPVGQVLFLRGLFALPWIVLLAILTGGLDRLKVKNIRGQSLRAVFVVGSSYLFVNGLLHLSLADAIAVTFTGPLFITAMAPFALGEQVGWRRWLAVLIGFAGVLFMVRPDGDVIQWAVLFPLGAALCGSTRDLITRRISQTETSIAVLFFTTCTVVTVSLLTLPFGWSAIRLEDMGLFAASSLLVAGGQYMMIEAFRHGEAALVAPLKYTFMIWAVLFGYLFFGDLPDVWTVVGTLTVAVAGLYVLQREMRVTKRPLSAGPRPPAR